MTRRKPPGPKGLPIIGITHRFIREPFSYRERVVEEYGDIVTMPDINYTNYMLAHPDYVRQVLVDERDRFEKFRQSELSQLVGNGLLLNEGESWRRQRQLIQPLFFREQLASYVDTMVEYTRRMADSWTPGTEYDVEREMRRLTLQIICKTMFDRDPSQGQSAISEAFERTAGKFHPSRSKLPIPDWLPIASNVQFEDAIDELDEAVADLIAERKRDDEQYDDLLSVLLAAQTDAEHEVSDELVRDEIVTMMLAGNDTTAMSLTFIWYLLSRNPEARERLQAELDEELPDGSPTLEDVAGLDFLDRVVRESMRIYPAVHSISRRAVEDVEVDGYDVPAGSRVFLAPWVTHRLPEFWPEPETFRPDRWTRERVEDRHEFAFFPFGAGPRRCIGRKFALLEAKVVVATLAARFDLDLRPGYDLELFESITVQPKHGMPMTVTERS